MTRRPGITLVEVLVAILIVGVGLLALLTLFPLGALEMAQAVKDDRCGHIKHNIAAIANSFALRADAYIRDNGLLNPGAPLPALNNPADPNYGGFQESVSYPVFV